MGYEAAYRGRIELDPPMRPETWQPLEGREDFGTVLPGARKVLDPVIVPVLSGRPRLVVAVEPGRFGCEPSTMAMVLRDFVWYASLFLDEDEGRCRRFSGEFIGEGEDGTWYRLTIGETDPVRTEALKERP